MKTALSLLPSLLLVAATPASPAAIRASAPPVSDATLSLFEGVSGFCRWVRLDPIAARREVIAEFAEDCSGVSASWSPDGTEAIVDFPGEWTAERGRERRVFRIDLATNAVTPLALPDAGDVDTVAFGADGVPVAITLQTPAVPRSGLVSRAPLEHEGVRYPVPEHSPGLPSLAIAWRLERGAWREAEVAATTVEACDALGTVALETARLLATTSTAMLDPQRLENVRPIEPALAARMPAHDRGGDPYTWVQIDTERGTIVALESSFDGAYLMTPVLVVDGGEVRPLEGVPESAVIAANARGRYLLVSDAVSGTRPVLVDLELGKSLWSDLRAVSVTLWPGAPAPGARSALAR